MLQDVPSRMGISTVCICKSFTGAWEGWVGFFAMCYTPNPPESVTSFCGLTLHVHIWTAVLPSNSYGQMLKSSLTVSDRAILKVLNLQRSVTLGAAAVLCSSSLRETRNEYTCHLQCHLWILFGSSSRKPLSWFFPHLFSTLHLARLNYATASRVFEAPLLTLGEECFEKSVTTIWVSSGEGNSSCSVFEIFYQNHQLLFNPSYQTCWKWKSSFRAVVLPSHGHVCFPGPYLRMSSTFPDLWEIQEYEIFRKDEKNRLFAYPVKNCLARSLWGVLHVEWRLKRSLFTPKVKYVAKLENI